MEEKYLEPNSQSNSLKRIRPINQFLTLQTRSNIDPLRYDITPLDRTPVSVTLDRITFNKTPKTTVDTPIYSTRNESLPSSVNFGDIPSNNASPTKQSVISPLLNEGFRTLHRLSKNLIIPMSETIPRLSKASNTLVTLTRQSKTSLKSTIPRPSLTSETSFHIVNVDVVEPIQDQIMLHIETDQEFEHFLAPDNHEIPIASETSIFGQQVPQNNFTSINSYIPTLPDEIEINVGDIVNIVHHFPDDWVLGGNLTKGSTGIYPFICISNTPFPPFVSQNQQQSDYVEARIKAPKTVMILQNEYTNGDMELERLKLEKRKRLLVYVGCLISFVLFMGFGLGFGKVQVKSQEKT